MSFRYTDVKVGDYIRDYKNQCNWTVAAVFEDGSVMTAGRDCQWFSSGEYKILNTSDRKKHEKDVRYFAYAVPGYMHNDDPRALSNRRYLENRGITTANAKNIIEDEFIEFVDNVIEHVIDMAKVGDIESFSDVTSEINTMIESSGYISYQSRLIEGLYASLSDPMNLDKGERDFIERIARRTISDTITNRFRGRNDISIDLDDPRTIEGFLEHFNLDYN